MKTLGEFLDEKMSEPGFQRKASNVKTDETPIYDQFNDMWIESDDQFRARIKASIKEPDYDAQAKDDAIDFGSKK